MLRVVNAFAQTNAGEFDHQSQLSISVRASKQTRQTYDGSTMLHKIYILHRLDVLSGGLLALLLTSLLLKYPI